VGVVLVLLSGCALFPRGDPEQTSARTDLTSFTEEVRDAIAIHEWQTILSFSDPLHYRTQVVDLGIDEAQYIAELFGLHQTDNEIQDGDELDWEDLERIESVLLAPSDAVGPPYVLSGTATLTTGEQLQLRADVTVVQGRLVLTGGVG
jgi:hypothetical protein